MIQSFIGRSALTKIKNSQKNTKQIRVNSCEKSGVTKQLVEKTTTAMKEEFLNYNVSLISFKNQFKMIKIKFTESKR